MENYQTGSRIEFVDRANGAVYQFETFNSELEAQNRFDRVTIHGSEHSGAVRVDLIVSHITEGDIVRRSMFIPY